MKYEINKNVESFLNELTELTKKYGIEIGACGCCNSPFLVDCENGNIIEDGLIYNEDRQEYEF